MNRPAETQWEAMPLSAPAYAGPPYLMSSESRAINVFYRTDPTALRREIPYPLEPDDDPMVRVMVGDMVQPPHSIAIYHEGVISVRVRFGDRRGWYTPYIWTHSDEAMLVGRELYGWPKLICDDGRLTFVGNQIFGEIRRRGELLVRVSFQVTSPPPGRRDVPEEERLKNILLGSDLLQVRYFPSPEKNGRPLRQVVLIKLEDVQIAEIWGGNATVELFPSGAYPNLHRLVCLEPVYACYVRPQFILPHGQVLWEE